MSARRNLVTGILFILMCGVVWGSVASDLQTAQKEKKVVFLIVTEMGATGIEQAKSTVKEAMKSVPKSTMIELNRSIAENVDLVGKYRVGSAPVPLILVIASNGAVAGGLPSANANAEVLTQIVPSPKKAEMLLALQAGQAIFLTASKSSMTGKAKVFDACAAACGQLKDKSVNVKVDMDDPGETAFLEELKINTASTEPVTVVINAQGQVAGNFTGAVEVGPLVMAATKKVTGGCCPPGSGKSCGPTKK